MNYADRPYEGGALRYYAWQPFAIVPLWNRHGQADAALLPNGQCVVYSGVQRCVDIQLQQGWLAYNRRSGGRNPAWHGSLLEDQKDLSGTLYRRNRQFDPTSGRFTQEDPLGLAGGLNLYGFAGGDPVSYSDPFGLCPPKTMAEVLICTGQILQPAQRPLEIAGTVVTMLPFAAEAGATEATIGLSTREATLAEQTVARLGTKLGNQLSKLDRGHLSIASRELDGFASGWDHVTEVREAMTGVSQTINKLKRFLANPNLEADSRAAGQRLLGRASRALDAAEDALRR